MPMSYQDSISRSQASKLGDAPVGIPPFFINNYRLVSVNPKFLLLHMSCAILEMSFYFHFACYFNEILRTERFLIKQSPQIGGQVSGIHIPSMKPFSMSFTLVLHLYPMSKLLSKLNVMKLISYHAQWQLHIGFRK